MKSRELKQVGQVAIDSGRIAITDPEHLKADAPQHCIHNHKTSHGDGTFPVFTFTEDGHQYLAVRISTLTAAELKGMFAGQGQQC